MKHSVKDGKTYFTLAEGSVLLLGVQKVTLTEKTEFVIDGEHARDSVVEMIFASGNGSVNAENVKSVETRTENRGGKEVKVRYEISYGGRAQRLERETEVVEETENAPKVETVKKSETPKKQASKPKTAAKKDAKKTAAENKTPAKDSKTESDKTAKKTAENESEKEAADKQ